jgi:hypothetical protein
MELPSANRRRVVLIEFDEIGLGTRTRGGEPQIIALQAPTAHSSRDLIANGYWMTTATRLNL